MKRSNLNALILLFSLCIVGCQKKEPMYNNPSNVIIYKEDETLSSLAKRVLGTKVDSLGIPIPSEQTYSVYESTPFWVTGIYDQPGHPIFDIELKGCENQNKFLLGDLFGDLGCNKETLLKLKMMAEDTSSNIKEMCLSAESDPEQTVIAYADTKKEIYWTVRDGNIFTVGAYQKFMASGEDGIAPCDKGVREQYKIAEAKRVEEENKWYSPVSWLGQPTGECRVNEGGPAKFIESLENLHQTFSIENEVKAGDKVIQTEIVVNNTARLYYFRGKSRCDAFVNSVINNKKERSKSIEEKYN